VPEFSTESFRRLETCDVRLMALFSEVIKTYACTVLRGARTVEEEQIEINAGRSQLARPIDSKHVIDPKIRPFALAVDVAPDPVQWLDTRPFIFFAGYVRRVAEQLHIGVRWGGAWTGKLNDVHQFNDLDHFELIP
jgi:hypothetical protein